MKSRVFLYISLATDVLIAISKFVAAAISGSSAMISEGIHSVIDAVSQLLLIIGVKASKRPADKTRPFGYGKEFYFWSFIVSLIIFILGGCISFFKGIMQLRHPTPAGDPKMDYVILGIAFVFNTVSMFSALKAFNEQRGKMSFWRAVVLSKDPSTFIVLLGDFGDLVGLVVAFLGVYLRHLLNDPYYDGVASMVIGVILVAISILLVRESKSLLMGETIGRKTLREIVAVAEADASVIKVKKNFSMYMAPEEALIQLNTIFKNDLDTEEITTAIQRIVKDIQEKFPKVKQIFIEPVAK